MHPKCTPRGLHRNSRDMHIGNATGTSQERPRGRQKILTERDYCSKAIVEVFAIWHLEQYADERIHCRTEMPSQPAGCPDMCRHSPNSDDRRQRAIYNGLPVRAVHDIL